MALCHSADISQYQGGLWEHSYVTQNTLLTEVLMFCSKALYQTQSVVPHTFGRAHAPRLLYHSAKLSGAREEKKGQPSFSQKVQALSRTQLSGCALCSALPAELPLARAWGRVLPGCAGGTWKIPMTNTRYSCPCTASSLPHIGLPFSHALSCHTLTSRG